jgi:pimeloyl-ACP methyl ester carboxylesterase
MQIISKTLSQEGYDIRYTISGNKTNPSIVFLHPAFCDHTCFYKQIDVFSKNYFVITLDLIGHGSSQIRKSKDKIDRSACHIMEILKQEGVKRCHVVGVSLGSLIAQYFAYSYPDNVLSVTVMGGYSIHKDNTEILKVQRKEGLKWLFLLLFSMKQFRKYVSKATVISTHEQEILYKSLLKFTRKSFYPMSGMNELFKFKQQGTHYPLLLVCGDHDLPIAQKTMEEWHITQATSQYFLVPNAGHCANMDNEKSFNERLSVFIENINSLC